MEDRAQFRESDLKSALGKLFASESPATAINDELIAGKYNAQKIIGCEGQSTIVLANEPKLDRMVVLKIYHTAAQGIDQARIVNEGRALSSIDSPNVVKCFGVETLEENTILVLEYIEGNNLFDLGAVDSPGTALRILRQLAEGLHAVHHSGLLHLDLKPANAVMTVDGIVKLIDFGLVQRMDRKLPWAGSGSPAFMSPEVARGELDVDVRTDIFGLGTVLYFLLTNHPPFEGASSDDTRDASKNCRLKPVQAWKPNVAKSVSQLCMRCLAPSVEDRFASTTQLLQAIECCSHRFQNRAKAFGAMVVVALLTIVSIVSFQIINTTNSGTLNEVVMEVSLDTELRKLKVLENQVLSLIANGYCDEAIEKQAECLKFVQNSRLKAEFAEENRLKFDFLKGLNADVSSPKCLARFQRAIGQLVEIRKTSRLQAVDGWSKETCRQAFTKLVEDLEVETGTENVFVLIGKHDYLTALGRTFGMGRSLLHKEALSLVDQCNRLLHHRSALAMQAKELVGDTFRGTGKMVAAEQYYSSVIDQAVGSEGYTKMLKFELQLKRAMVLAATSPLVSEELLKSYFNYKQSIGEPDSISSNYHQYIFRFANRDIEQAQKLAEAFLDEVANLPMEGKMRDWWLSVICRQCSVYAFRYATAKDGGEGRKEWQVDFDAANRLLSRATDDLSGELAGLQKMDARYSADLYYLAFAVYFLASIEDDLEKQKLLWDECLRLQNQAIVLSEDLIGEDVEITRQNASDELVKSLFAQAEFAVSAGREALGVECAERAIQLLRISEQSKQFVHRVYKAAAEAHLMATNLDRARTYINFALDFVTNQKQLHPSPVWDRAMRNTLELKVKIEFAIAKEQLSIWLEWMYKLCARWAPTSS